MNTQVLDGYRTPRGDRPASAPAHEMTSIPEGKRIFKSHARSLRLQLTAPEDARLPDGRVIKGRPVSVLFSERFKILDETKDIDIIVMMLESPAYGVDFWDYADDLERMKATKVNTALEILQDPEGRAAVIEALRASGEADFLLPKTREKKSEATDPSQT